MKTNDFLFWNLMILQATVLFFFFSIALNSFQNNYGFAEFSISLGLVITTVGLEYLLYTKEESKISTIKELIKEEIEK